MFRHYFAICAFALSYCWSQFAHAEIPFDQSKGVYAATKDDQKENSPLWGMASLRSKILENIRFFGPYNIYSEKTDIFANEQEMQNHLGCVETIKLLLDDKRVDVNAKGDYGDTPLHRIIRVGGEVEIVKLLLAKGAKFEQSDIDKAATEEIKQLLHDAMAKQDTHKKE